MIKKGLSFILFYLMAYVSYGQIGGLRSFEFLEIPTHAKVAGLGTVNISSPGDVNMVNQNPALLDSSMNNEFSFTFAPYFDDIINTQVNYAYNFQKIGLIQFGVFYQSLGKFNGYDITGDPTTEFTAGNYSINIAHSRTSGVFTYGANLKLAGTQIESYRSSALLLDLGGIFKHPDIDFTAAMAIKNVGFYVAKNVNEERNLPFDIQLGSSFKPEFMPFRFSITLNRMYQYNLSYYEPMKVDPNDPFMDANEEAPSGFDKLFQHVTLGTELLIGKNVSLRGGYNHLIRQSLRTADYAGAGGFTFGINIKTKKLQLAYSRAMYQLGGAANYFTFSTNFQKLFKKNSI